MDISTASSNPDEASQPSRLRSPAFPTTQWSVVVDAAHTDPERVRQALEKLCQRYWYPIYSFVRQREHDHHHAEDLTQSFFYFVLTQQVFSRAAPERGRFRTFVLAALKNFLLNEYDKTLRQKRGGKHQIISLDEKLAEEFFRNEPADQATPEKHFERTWAVMLVRRVFDQLRDEFLERGKAGVFAALQPYLTGETSAGDYERLAKTLGMEDGAVKVALHRARRRFGELLRHEIAHTVTGPEEIEAELRQLLAAISS